MGSLSFDFVGFERPIVSLQQSFMLTCTFHVHLSTGEGEIIEMGNNGDENNPCWSLDNNQLTLSLSPADNS